MGYKGTTRRARHRKGTWRRRRARIGPTVGNRVRVTAQLIHATDTHLWAQDFDQSSDVLKLEADVPGHRKQIRR